MLDGLLQQLLQFVGAVGGRGRRLARALHQQQVQVLVEAADGLVQLLDGGVRDELAAQALEHRGEQRVDEGEVGDLAVARITRPRQHGEHRQQLLRLILQRAQVHRLVPREQAQLAGAAGVGAGGQQRVVDDVHQVRPGHRVGGPDELAGGAEHGDAGGARQQRAHQAHVGLEAATRLAGHVLAWRRLVHVPQAGRAKAGNGSSYDCAYVALGPCASWRIRAPGAPVPPKTLNRITPGLPPWGPPPRPRAREARSALFFKGPRP